MIGRLSACRRGSLTTISVKDFDFGSRTVGQDVIILDTSNMIWRSHDIDVPPCTRSLSSVLQLETLLFVSVCQGLLLKLRALVLLYQFQLACRVFGHTHCNRQMHHP